MATGSNVFGVSYSYDSLNRLTNADYGNGSVISYTYDPAGNRLTYSGAVANDTNAPTIAITNPTSGPSFTTSNATVNLSGTAADNTGVSLITWAKYSDYSVSIGTASGTTSWNINGIPLETGANYIFVTAYDLAGNSADATLSVTYTPPVGPAIQSSFSNGSLNLSWPAASASDFVLQYADSLSPPILWSNFVATVTTNSGTLNIILSTTNAQRFFRLKKGGNTSVAPTNMALIPAGPFQMGDTFSDSDSYALPSHTVYVSEFSMDKYEVTKALWDDVYNWAITHGYSFEYGAAGKAANHPAQNMTWYDAMKWCNARSQKEGRTPAYYTSAAQTTVYQSGQTNVQNDWVKWSNGYRLPTEAEWEKAARGGLSGHRFPWADSDTISWSRANYKAYPSSAGGYAYDINLTAGYHPNFQSGGFPYTSPVGSFAPNGYGLYDMAGNVWEWCWDWCGSYASGSQTDPQGSASGSARVLRGGSWFNDAFNCRAANRNFNGDPTYRSSAFGFRSVLPPGQ